MIELKHVTKIYKSKKGPNTKALDDISLTLGEKGLVFLVGRSGSGKSTLLNILGGLDTITSGEIIINNQRINTFKEKDYDDYRNSFVGFIFQEFNLLEEYNVEENIALALELQNQKTSLEEIQELLTKLDLTGLEKRKINELSGGQKQRVAILRALIKNPKLILADEPTGNLDSNSSTQIFEILKNLSKDSLVVVVSHDMDFALKYADEIISIKDGKILEIKGSTEKKQEKNISMKHTHLPFKYIWKSAWKNMKASPIKLVMTVVLLGIFLGLTGLLTNCFLFNQKDFIIHTMKINKEYIFKLNYKKGDHGEGFTNQEISNQILEDLKSKTPDIIYNDTYTLFDDNKPLTFTYGESSSNEEVQISSFIEVKDDRLLENIIGSKQPLQTN